MDYTLGTFDYIFFNDYIKQYLTQKELKIINNLWKNLYNDEKYIDYISIPLKGYRDYIYNELILLDVLNDDNLYMFVFVQNINTSSQYSLVKSQYDDNYDCSDDEDYQPLTLDIITNMLLPIYDKNKFRDTISQFL